MPMGTMASMAFTPVCSGSLTGWRSRMPGALNSTGRRLPLLTSPLSSTGTPSGLTTLPISSCPTGTSRTRPGPLDLPALVEVEVVAQDDGADAVLLEVQGKPEDAGLELEHLHGHGPAHAVDAGDAVAELDDGADLVHGDVPRIVADLFADPRRNLFKIDAHASPLLRRLCPSPHSILHGRELALDGELDLLAFAQGEHPSDEIGADLA